MLDFTLSKTVTNINEIDCPVIHIVSRRFRYDVLTEKNIFPELFLFEMDFTSNNLLVVSQTVTIFIRRSSVIKIFSPPKDLHGV